MKNVKANVKNHPFKPKEVDTVGSNYRERQAFIRRQGPSQGARIPVRKQIDQFNRQGKNAKNLAKFAPKVAYKASSIFSRDIPYKARVHDYVERGMPKSAAVKNPPSDKVMLNFLDKVISATAKPVAQKVNSSKYHMGRPAVRTRTVAQVRTRPAPKIKS